jgi:hypothetical protein
MNLTECCIFCGSTDNLNTSLTVKIDNDRHAVSVCDDCEDDAAPKVVKKLVEKHLVEHNKEQQEIEKLRELASKHGLILIPEKEEIERLAPSAPPEGSGAIVQKAASQTEPAKLIPQKAASGSDDVTPRVPITKADGVAAESHSSYRIGGELKQVRKLDQEVKTESRGPIRIPSRILDNEGNRTTIRIAKTTDADLQKRFKSAAAAEATFGQGYQTRDCTTCGGTGVSRLDKKSICPKCGGEGQIV